MTTDIAALRALLERAKQRPTLEGWSCFDSHFFHWLKIASPSPALTTTRKDRAMADKSSITPALLRQLLRYEPETGNLYWRRRTPDVFNETKCYGRERTCATWNGTFAGKKALFSICGAGYPAGRVLTTWLMAHRVIWAIVHDEWPRDQIDHINGDPTDNRIANLREVTNQGNGRNQAMHSDNTSGVAGVHWRSRDRRWIAQIRVDGTHKHLGCFTDITQAIAVRKAAEREFGFHPNHGKPRP